MWIGIVIFSSEPCSYSFHNIVSLNNHCYYYVWNENEKPINLRLYLFTTPMKQYIGQKIKIEILKHIWIVSFIIIKSMKTLFLIIKFNNKPSNRYVHKKKKKYSMGYYMGSFFVYAVTMDQYNKLQNAPSSIWVYLFLLFKRSQPINTTIIIIHLT